MHPYIWQILRPDQEHKNCILSFSVEANFFCQQAKNLLQEHNPFVWFYTIHNRAYY